MFSISISFSFSRCAASAEPPSYSESTPPRKAKVVNSSTYSVSAQKCGACSATTKETNGKRFPAFWSRSETRFKKPHFGARTVKAEMKETRKSFGIGGAGNIRKPTDIAYPPRKNSDGSRRRSSVWSSSTTSTLVEKRDSWMGMFRRKKSVDEGKAAEFQGVDFVEKKVSVQEGKVAELQEVDLVGKKENTN